MTSPPPADGRIEQPAQLAAAPPPSGRPAQAQRGPQLAERGQSRWYRVGKRVLGYAILLFFAALFIAPFALALANSFKSRPETLADPLSLIPAEPTLRAYEIMAQTDIPRWTMNSVLVTVMVTVARLFLDSLAGYALARLRFPGRTVIFALVVAVLAVPPIVLAIPRYLVLGQLGMLDTYGGLILPLAVDAFGIFLMKTFFESIPREMEEAARIDGASIFQTFTRIILPLATPGLIALTILSFQGSWNEFLHPLIAAPTNASVWTLPLGLSQSPQATGESLNTPVAMAGSMLTTLPVLVVFLVFQRFFIQGVAATGVKG
jgi:multiple sugar transport system permease protein